MLLLWQILSFMLSQEMTSGQSPMFYLGRFTKRKFFQKIRSNKIISKFYFKTNKRSFLDKIKTDKFYSFGDSDTITHLHYCEGILFLSILVDPLIPRLGADGLSKSVLE